MSTSTQVYLDDHLTNDELEHIGDLLYQLADAIYELTHHRLDCRGDDNEQSPPPLGNGEGFRDF